MKEGILLDDLCGEDRTEVIVDGIVVEVMNGSVQTRHRGYAGDTCLVARVNSHLVIVAIESHAVAIT